MEDSKIETVEMSTKRIVMFEVRFAVRVPVAFSAQDARSIALDVLRRDGDQLLKATAELISYEGTPMPSLAG